ncbi:hypothetical protein [Nitratifractor sp.]
MKKAKGFQSIVTIDNYNDRYYRFANGQLDRITKLRFSRAQYFSTFVANKDLIIAPVSVSANIDEADLAGVLEDKAYDELGLDPATEYMIRYEPFEGEGEGKQYHLFILEQNRYDELFGNLRKELRYVDLIAPAPLLYRTLYDEGILEKNRVHCFFYFTFYDTTLTFYKNGEFLYSKSINYSLNQLYDRYCEIAGKTVDEKQFFRIFQKEGVKTTHLEYQQNLIKLFNEIFITINDIIIYTKRAYKIDVIDQMFIGSELGPISGADEYAQNYLGLNSSAMIFDFKIKSDEWYVDQLQFMLAIASERYIEDPARFVNFTRYPRPPAFHKRPSGQFLIATAAALLIASAYPLYFLGASYVLQVRNMQLSSKEQKLTAEVNKYRAILTQKRKELAALDKEIARLKKVYTEKEKTLVSVYNKKVNYRLKSDQLALFSNDLVRYGLHSDQMRTSGDTYALTLYANDDRNITKLIQHITNDYGQEIEAIDIQRIKHDENTSAYTGVLKVKMR